MAGETYAGHRVARRAKSYTFLSVWYPICFMGDDAQLAFGTNPRGLGDHMMFYVIMMVVALALPWCVQANATSPVLIKDIHAGVEPSAPASLTAVGERLFFRADDGIHGLELWQSDGSSTGTTLVADIRSGSGHSVPDNLTEVNGALYFSADDGIHGTELWQSDGTADGTRLVADLNPGPEGSFPSELIHMNGVLYFQAHDGRHGTELWQSDGTAPGTRRLEAWNPFRRNDRIQDFELWTGRSRAEAASLVLDIHPGSGSSLPHALVYRKDTLYFVADDGRHGLELWQSQGTAESTKLAVDINPGRGTRLYQRLDRRWADAVF